jgi:hypothetical protein
MPIPASTGRPYAHQMIDSPYIRYRITEDVRSRIVPTPELQKP